MAELGWICEFADLGREDVELAGGKAANLGELTRAGFPVPPGFVLTTAAYSRFVSREIADVITAAVREAADGGRAEDFDRAAETIRTAFRAEAVPSDLHAQIEERYSRLVEPRVAVRSSATAEDLADASFAGQQDSYLNVSGLAELTEKVRDCWASLWTARAMAYRHQRKIDPATVRLAVVVQEMVQSESAGVMFTANPANGHRDVVVISAARGLGEAVVSGTVDTEDLVLAKSTGALVSGSTGILTDQAARELAVLGTRIEQHYNSPQDIEWAFADQRFAIVQSRPITALGEPEGPVPTSWPIEDKGFYFRASIVEQLPDPLSPLFADLIDPAVTRSLQKLMDEFVGTGVVRAEDVSLPTVNGYAYYRYTRDGMIRLTLRTPLAMRVLKLTGQGNAVDRWRDYAHPRYQQMVQRWTARDLAELDDQQLLAGVAELLDAGAEYYTSVQTIIPIAASTEVLFGQFFRRLVHRAGDPTPAVFLLGFDSAPIRAEKSLWDLARWVRERDDDLADWLLDTPTAGVLQVVDAERDGAGEGSAVQRAWARRFAEHLAAYGSAVYNLDFVNAVAADAPAPMLETLRFYLRGEGKDPHARQAAAARRRDDLSRQTRQRLDPVRRAVFDRLLGWAQRAAPVREDALADVGLAWPQMRRMLAELGGRLVNRGVLTDPAEVYWLRRAELADLSGSATPPAKDLTELITQRKLAWRGQRRATPPQALPKTWWMDALESMMPARSQVAGGDTLKGIGASAGKVTARARVLAGPAEFDRLRPGEALVAGITTPAWTSLFAMASAVVTDIGGPLSHSSIVAREYGIPAVLGTSEATKRIRSGQEITVDGDAGVVRLTAAGDRDDSVTAGPELMASRRGAATLAGVGLVLVGVIAWRRTRRLNDRGVAGRSRR